MRTSDITADCIVLGGGPAGAVAARLLAREGARVVLVDPDRALPRLEGISDRLMTWLQGEGLAAWLPDLSSRVPRRATWAGTASDHNGEHLVERASMNAALRAAAAEAGATVVTASAQVAPDRGGVFARLSDGRAVAAARAIDARGRAAHAGRPVRRGPATLAVGGWLTESGDRVASAQVAPFADGWVWIARPGDGRVWVQAALDAREGGSASPTERLMAALAAAAADLDPLPGGTPEGVHVRDCAPALREDIIDPRLLPAGDAAAGMDPLSGNGMLWAVSGALAAIAALRTLAARPGAASEDLARRFLGERIRETYERQARLGRDFLRQETRFRDRPFWARRLGFPDNAPVHAEASAPGTVRRAIVVDGGLLAEREILVTAEEPAGVAWVAGVPIVEAWRRWRAGAGEAALAAEWGPEAAGAAIGWLRARALV